MTNIIATLPIESAVVLTTAGAGFLLGVTASLLLSVRNLFSSFI